MPLINQDPSNEHKSDDAAYSALAYALGLALKPLAAAAPRQEPYECVTSNTSRPESRWGYKPLRTDAESAATSLSVGTAGLTLGSDRVRVSKPAWCNMEDRGE